MTPFKTFVLAVVPFCVLLNSVSAFVTNEQSGNVRENVAFSGCGEPKCPAPSATQLHMTMLANVAVEMQEVVTPLSLAISAMVVSHQMDKDPDFFATKFQFKTKKAEAETTGTLAVGSSASAAVMGTMEATELEAEETEDVEADEEAEKTSVRKRDRILKVVRFVVNRARGRSTASA